MSSRANSSLSRRALLVGTTGLAAVAAFGGGVRGASTPAREFRLSAAPGRWSFVGKSGPATDVYCYGNSVPGPELRVRQGELLRIVVRNDLAEDTTVHWHGIRLPNAMDGVPGLTQPPIKPGEEFVYEFVAPDAGTFWYHPHANSLQQLGQGLAGVLIVEEPEPFPVDRELVWMLSDWRLGADAQFASGFGNSMEAAMAGRVGNTVTINGAISDEIPVKAGERIRLRLLNGALARVMSLRFDGHRPVIVATDGQPCEPHEADRIMLGPAMRVDVILDLKGRASRRYRVIDDFYSDRSYWLTELVYGETSSALTRRPDAPFALARSPVPDPDISSAERHELKLQGGMMGGAGMMGMGGLGHGAAWAINGTSMTGDGHSGMTPLLTLKLGRSYVFTIRNDTAWWHPIHLHGHSFHVLSRNGSPVPYRQLADTILIPPRETADIAFVADNSGDWMLHCHVTDHQMSGMMTVIRVI